MKLYYSPDEFIEEQVSKILPKWEKSIVGIHTINHADQLTVTDVLRNRLEVL